MKVYTINFRCGQGSTGRMTTEISDAIQKHGGNCRIAYSRGEAPDFYDTFKIGNKLDLYSHALFSRITDRQAFFSHLSTKSLINDIVSYSPDIIHLHNIHGYYLNMPMLFNFFRLYNRPIVWTLHDCWAFTGHCSHFTKVSCNKWQTGCSKCPQKKDYPTSWFFDNSKKNWNEKKLLTSDLNLTVVTVSHWLEEVVRKSFLSGNKIFTIHNGIDLNTFFPRKTNIRNKLDLIDKFIILGVASDWSESKGIKDFYKLAETLDDRYHFIIIGVENNKIKKDLNNFTYIGRISDINLLCEYYSCADLYFNSSIEETFGLTTIEAMACGTPAIVYRSTGLPEVLSDFPELIANPRDVDDVIRIIKLVENGNIDLSRMENVVKEKYDIKNQYEHYIDLYESLMRNV